MKPHSRFVSHGMVKLVSLILSYSLIATIAVPPGSARESHSPVNSAVMAQPGLLGLPGRVFASFLNMLQGGGQPSVPGTGLPDLDVARSVQSSDPGAPAAIVSDQACTDCTPCPSCGPGTTNHAPGVDAGGPYYCTAGTPLVVNGLGSFDVDPGDGISVYAWTFGDGTGVFNGAMPQHTYQSAGSYSISLTVTDGHNATAMASTTASITAAPPSVPPSNPTQGNAALFIAQTVPTTMTAGQSYPVSVTMRNIGTTTWSAAHLYRLGSENPLDNSIWGKSRVLLPTTVAPGADVTFNFTVIAPYSGADQPPPAQFQWRMVQEFVQWFDTSSPSQTVTIVSNYQPPNPGGPQYSSFSNLFASRIAVDHRTGQSGEDLLSGNYNWGVGLVSLAGRSGMNLNLGLSYNSLAAWTKVVPATTPGGKLQATSFTFDADRSLLSVGFRLGFPSIQGPFSNTQTGSSSYLMLLPSGGRVELRRLGATTVYEAADSSYLQLVDGGNGSLLVRTTDGTQLAYWSINSEYRCTALKDRNGNYLTIKYDPINGTANLGRMTSIIDTLGRTLNFNYDSNYRLQSITQLRNGQTHVWASFGYTALSIVTNFTSSSGPAPVVLGLPTNHIVSVITQVGLDDGSRYTFDYTSWGQVYRIKHFAADGHQLSYTSYNLPLDNSTAQSDSPRFTQRQDWAENWNNNNSVATNFQSDTNGNWNQVTTPDGTAYREYATREYTDWKRGLVTKTEVYSSDNASVAKKTTITDWTQDLTNVAYPLNPRPTATTISDLEGNRRRTTIEYTAFGLPADVYEMGPYGANDWQTLRRQHTDYNLSEAYVNRRIIGLVAGQYLFAPDANGYSIQALMSKTTMEYDVGGEFLAEQGNPSQHDASYGTGLTTRGNVTRVLRWDLNYENDINHATASTSGYNTCGSTIFSRDELAHQTSISYADSFSTNGVDATSLTFATMAYPTSVTDPDGFASMAKYNYDLGTYTLIEGPAPLGHQHGTIQTTEYDSAGRVKRITNAVNSAYTRFVYPPSQTIVNKFSKVDVDVEPEAYTATVYDGAGRVRAVAGDLPNSTGHYSGQFTRYDIKGQAVQQTNPTEMNHAWSAAGDDLVGWHSSSQTFDWKGRPLVTTNQDGTTREASYGGCGCAGAAVVTLTDEGTIDAGTAKRRQQKVYSDALGRVIKTELLNWQGGSPYATTINTYNARNQLTRVRHFDNAQGTVPSDPNDLSCPTGSCQKTTMIYDGYGRLQSKHLPQQGSGAGSSYIYNSDDTVRSTMDARGASATYDYNNRHQVTAIAYSAPAGITPTANVTFAYDGAGNRTSMTDGLGSQSYTHNQLSQLTSETRTFTGVGAFTLSYNYNLAGELKKITDSTGMTINYSYDALGRPTGVTGSDSLYVGVSTYASNFQYRAWGGLKTMTDGRGYVSSFSYNSMLRPSQFDISGGTVHQDYDYYDDGQIKMVGNTTDQNFNRYYSYDHAGRTVDAKSGIGSSFPAPYQETFGYNAFSDLTARSSDLWSGIFSDSDAALYTDNRRSGWIYDADGRNTAIDTRAYTFDAVGRRTVVTGQALQANGSHVPVTQTTAYDGTGAMIYDSASGAGYYVRSSALGGAIVEEIGSNGQKNVGYVYTPMGTLLARQSLGFVHWKHNSPLSTSQYSSNSANFAIERVELDPLNADVPLTAPTVPPPSEGDGDFSSEHFGALMDSRWSDFTNLSAGCSVAGVAASCSGHMLGTNLDGAMLGFFGYSMYDLPGHNDEMARAGERYESYRKGGYDPELKRYDSVTITYSSGMAETKKNLTLDEYREAQTELLTVYGADTSITDLEHNTVTVFGGAEYYVSPQNARPTITFGPNHKELVKPFQDAFDDMVDRLKKSEECAKLFGGLDKALNTLNSASYRLFDDPIKTTFKDGKFVPSVTGAMTAENTVFINLAGPFFNGPNLKMSGNRSFRADFGTGLEGTKLAALLLLHELGHQVGKWGSDAGVGDKDKNLEHTMAVYQACF